MIIKNNNTYKYIKNRSILYPFVDEYTLKETEVYKIYSFYVTYSMVGNQSLKKKSLIDYGWCNNDIINVKNALSEIIEINDNNKYVFVSKNEKNLKVNFGLLDLIDGTITDIDNERSVILNYNDSDNKLMNYFYRIRDGFAHGKFLLKKSSQNKKMVIIQDDDGNNVTARIVVKLDTLLKITEIIDKNKLI